MNFVCILLNIVGAVFGFRTLLNLWEASWLESFHYLLKTFLILGISFLLSYSIQFVPIVTQYTEYSVTQKNKVLLIKEKNCYRRAYNIPECKGGSTVTYNVADLFNAKRVTKYDMQSMELE